MRYQENERRRARCSEVILLGTYSLLGGKGCAGVGLRYEIGCNVGLQLRDAGLCSVNLLRQLSAQGAARVKVDLGRRVDGPSCLRLRGGKAGCQLIAGRLVVPSGGGHGGGGCLFQRHDACPELVPRGLVRLAQRLLE